VTSTGLLLDLPRRKEETKGWLGEGDENEKEVGKVTLRPFERKVGIAEELRSPQRSPAPDVAG